MSMNFSREQALLRQKLTAVGSRERAAEHQRSTGSTATFLGAEPAAVQAAADALVAAHPQIGRAQMTAFVRTLWRSRIVELRTVGVELLAARANLLEPADLPFLDELLGDCDVASLADRLAAAVLGEVVRRHKKLWKDLKRLAGHGTANRRRAAVLACRIPLLDDPEAFPRFAEIGTACAADADPSVLAALDELLAAVAAVHNDAVRSFAAAHGRAVVIPATPAATPAAAVMAAAVEPAAPTAVMVPAVPAAKSKPRGRAAKPAKAAPATRRATTGRTKSSSGNPPAKPTKGRRAPAAAKPAPGKAKVGARRR
jgi:hypothetical protein